MDLNSNAELEADKSRDLPEFQNFSLPGVRTKVAEILRLFGKVEGLFSTYTVHDITHIDAMLKMLDWLIPDSTRSIMSPLDWLITVLGIYFHDMGMVVAAQEFEQRRNNQEFTSWFDSLQKTSNGREYLARTNRMSAEEKERFFFQEFVRKGHAARIRDFITGRRSRIWGDAAEPISGEIRNLLKPLPSRFRDYLGLVCESHHLENLNDLKIYPLCARCGSDPSEVLNVQYAAILLRTADLLHITKDRTPSVEYEAIRFSDPKSVEEWDKQSGTFSVNMKGRQLNEKDPDSAVVMVNADFLEERPLFSLQEYITYANAQVQQSKRWADSSKELPDGNGYNFPWHTVIGDVRLEGVPPQPLRFELDRGRLLDLLVGHTIYNDPTVAVRELLQNAIDAVRYQYYLGRREKRSDSVPTMGRVVVKWNPNERILEVVDNGVGMDLTVIKYHLMKVGSSYYNTTQFEAEHRDFTPISRFGIGILTCFMVSDDIEIVTFRGTKGHRIRMTSVQADYLLRELLPGDLKLSDLEPHGTRITLRMRDTVDLSKRTIEDIVRYWVILPECEVEYIEYKKDPLKIGYKSAVEALRSFHSDDLATKQNFNYPLEFLVKRRDLSTATHEARDAGKYELAFTVRKSFLPEREFAFKPDKELPMVCIEGIRVSNNLPCFNIHYSNPRAGTISALLSVRGARQFRTTVSRTELEQDEAYDRVAQLCADKLCDHVEDEVTTIANRTGRPLSQASSASKWLYSTLYHAGTSADVRTSLDLRRETLEAIVIESVEGTWDKPITKRYLTSPREIKKMPEFWTVESRLVDSLGTISRDLGRELSLNEFLVKLAPDFTQLQYSPLFPDAYLFVDDFYSSHRPRKAEFSTKHQQTAIQWEPRNENDETASIRLAELCSPEFLKLSIDRVPNVSHSHYRFSSRRGFSPLEMRVEIAQISGDNEEVDAVMSRVGVVLKPHSNFQKIWLDLRAILLEQAQTENDIDSFGSTITVMNAFLTAFYRHYHIDPEFTSFWHTACRSFKESVRESSNVNLPMELDAKLMEGKVFDASMFWRDWRGSGFEDWPY